MCSERDEVLLVLEKRELACGWYNQISMTEKSLYIECAR